MRGSVTQRFSNWRSWPERNEHPQIDVPGVYAIAVTQKRLAGRPFAWQQHIVYVGMTNAKNGLKGRLQQFDDTMKGKNRHGGADRVRFEHRHYGAFCANAFVAIAPFSCDPASNEPKDLRVMGECAKFEFVCFARFAELFGALPRFNDKKNAPKYSRTAKRK